MCNFTITKHDNLRMWGDTTHGIICNDSLLILKTFNFAQLLMQMVCPLVKGVQKIFKKVKRGKHYKDF